MLAERRMHEKPAAVDERPEGDSEAVWPRFKVDSS
jgi:hypothetical protein